MRKLKKYGAAFCVALVLMCAAAVSAFATPDTLNADVTSTVWGIMNVKSPELSVSATNKRILPISAVANEGVRITVYRYNYDTGMYHKVWVNDTTLEAVVGSTGLFAGQVELINNCSKFIVRGENWDGRYQIERFEVNLVDGYNSLWSFMEGLG